MPQTWIGTRISSHLVPRSIWGSGYQGIPALDLPARDALDIERRWRKDVSLKNEARRYTVCCQRMQAIAIELVWAGAPVAPAILWPRCNEQAAPSATAVAYIAVFEYLRRHYKVTVGEQRTKTGLKHYRVEAIFHPPGELNSLAALLEDIARQATLAEICEQAAAKAEVTAGQHSVTASDCRAAFERRHSVVSKCVQDDLGLVDVYEVA